MSAALLAVLAAATCAAAGLWLVAGGFREPVLSLEAARRRLHREGVSAPAGASERLGSMALRMARPDGRPWSGEGVTADLALVGRSAEAHASLVVVAVLVGLAAPPLAAAASVLVGLAHPGWFAPLGASIGTAVVLPVAVHADMRTRAKQVRRDLRHQLSAFLDVVTMLLAGNVGNEGALRHAASAGDGRLFVELRRRMTEAETAGRSVVDALGALGDHLGIVELQQIAASASLASTEGAPVARSLAAKCSTLRSSLASEDEAAARIRTGKLSLPLVGMGIVIMALVIYPALNVTP